MHEGIEWLTPATVQHHHATEVLAQLQRVDNLAISVKPKVHEAVRVFFLSDKMIARDGNEPSSQRRHPAAVVALTSGRALVGPYDGRLAHGFQWVVFGVDALVLTGAVLCFTFVRFDRMF